MKVQPYPLLNQLPSRIRSLGDDFRCHLFHRRSDLRLDLGLLEDLEASEMKSRHFLNRMKKILTCLRRHIIINKV